MLGYFVVSIVHWTLTWTTGSLTITCIYIYICDLFACIIYTHGGPQFIVSSKDLFEVWVPDWCSILHKGVDEDQVNVGLAECWAVINSHSNTHSFLCHKVDYNCSQSQSICWMSVIFSPCDWKDKQYLLMVWDQSTRVIPVGVTVKFDIYTYHRQQSYYSF